LDGDIVCVERSTGRKIFRSNVVEVLEDKNSDTEELGKFICIARDQGMDLMTYSPDFSESCNIDLEGLRERVVFKIVPRSDVPPGTRIYGT
jgi:hypothetical protein